MASPPHDASETPRTTRRGARPDLDARTHAWALTGDSMAMWPGLGARDLPDATLALERTVAALLDGRATALGAADGRDARAVGVAAFLTGTGPLLGWWMERGLLDASAPLARLLARHLSHGRRRIGRMAHGARPVLAAMVDAGMRPVILKGFHTAHVYFPEPGVRTMADVDVMVAPEHWEAAEALLRAHGFAGAPHADGPFKREWHAPGDGRIRSVELAHAGSPWKMELHGALDYADVPRLYGVSLDAAAANVAPWPALGLPLAAPAHPLLLSLLATHLSTALYSTRLLRLVELVLVVRRDASAGRLDWRAVEELLGRTGMLRFAHPAFALAERLAPGTIDPRIAARARRASTWLGRRVVDGLTPATPSLNDRIVLAERLMWVAGPGQLARRLGGLVAPPADATPAELLRRYHGRLRRLVRGARGAARVS